MPGNYSDTTSIAAGAQITAAGVKTPIDDLDDALKAHAQGSGARLLAIGGLTAGGGVFTTLSFNSVLYDTGGYYSAGQPTRLTIPAAGRYLVGCNIVYETTADGTIEVWLYRNGATPLAQYRNADADPMGGIFSANVTTADVFSAGDYLQLLMYTDTGADVGIHGIANASPVFWIERLALA